MATERFSLTLDSKTTGTQEILQLIDAVKKLQAETAKAKATAAEPSGAKSLGENIRGFIEAPAQSAAQAVENMASKFGPSAVGAVALASGVAAAGAAIFELAKSTGEAAEQQANNAIRMGISVKEYGVLAAASRLAGMESDSLVRTMKGLSKAIEDHTIEGDKGARALRGLGLEARNAFGGMKGTSDLLLEIGDRIGGISSPYEKAKAAQDIFGKAGIQSLPLLNSELRTTVDHLKQLGIGFDDVSANRARKFEERVNTIIERLKQLGLRAGMVAIDIIDGPDSEGSKARQAKADAEKHNYWEYRRNSSLDLITPLGPSDLAKANPGLYPKAPTVADLSQTLETSRRGSIRLALEADQFIGIQEKIKREQADLSYAEEKGSAAQIVAIRGRIRSLEDELAIRTRVRAIAEEGLTGGVLIHDTGAAAIANAKSRPSAVPSLFRRDERALVTGYEFDPALGQMQGAGGTFKVTDAQIQEANQARLSAITEQGAARIAGENEKSARALGLSVEAEQHIADHEAKRFELLSGPGGELATVLQIAQIKLESLEKEIELGAEIFDAEERRAQIRRGVELQILDIRKQQREQFQEFTSGLVGASFGGGNSVQAYLRGQGQSIVTKMASNATGMMFPNGAPGILGGLTGTADNPTIVGKLLSGTILGPKTSDPLKTATDLNTAATNTNSAVMIAFGESLGISMPSGGGGVAGGGGSIGGTLGLGGGGGGIFSGSSSPLGMIFNNQPSVGSSAGVFGPPSADMSGDFSGIPMVGGGSQFSPDGGPGFLGQMGSMQGVTAGAGAAAGAMQIAKSGAKNKIGGIGTTLMSIAPMTGPAAPFLLAAGAAMKLASVFMGDPKKERADAIDKKLKTSQFVAPVSMNVGMDIGGGYSDYDKYGNVRTSSLSPFPVVEQPYFDYRHNTTVPGRTDSPYGGGATTINVNALDSSSFGDFLVRNADGLAAGLVNAIQRGGNGILPAIRDGM